MMLTCRLETSESIVPLLSKKREHINSYVRSPMNTFGVQSKKTWRSIERTESVREVRLDFRHVAPSAHFLHDCLKSFRSTRQTEMFYLQTGQRRACKDAMQRLGKSRYSDDQDEGQTFCVHAEMPAELNCADVV